MTYPRPILQFRFGDRTNINPLVELTAYRPSQVLCPSSHILHLQHRRRGLYRLPNLKTHDTCLSAPFLSTIPQIHVHFLSHRDMKNGQNTSNNAHLLIVVRGWI